MGIFIHYNTVALRGVSARGFGPAAIALAVFALAACPVPESLADRRDPSNPDSPKLNQEVNFKGADGQTYRLFHTRNPLRQAHRLSGRYMRNTIKPDVEWTLNRYLQWNFPGAYATTAPEFEIYFYRLIPEAHGFDSNFLHGIVDNRRMAMDASTLTAAALTKNLRYCLIVHEFGHAVQNRFEHRANQVAPIVDAKGVPTGELHNFHTWVAEGTADAFVERGNSRMDKISAIKRQFDAVYFYPGTSLIDRSYDANMYWDYAAHRLGDRQGEPDDGIDFLRKYFEAVSTAEADGGVLAAGESPEGARLYDEFLQQEYGLSFDDVYMDFALSHLFGPYNVSELDDWFDRFFIKDRHARTEKDDLPGYAMRGLGNYGYGGELRSAAYSPRVLHQRTGDRGIDIYEWIGFRAWDKGAKSTNRFALAIADNQDVVKKLIQQTGQDVADGFVLFDEDINRVFLTTLSGLYGGADADFHLEFGYGPLEMVITRPLNANPARVGPPDSPGHFKLRVRIAGPSNLSPEGVGSPSMRGVKAEDFVVKVDGEEAEVIGAAEYLGEYYELTVKAPEVGSQGTKQLLVSIQDRWATAQSDAVLYDDSERHSIVVLDVSGSMDDPSIAKYNRAEEALRFFMGTLRGDEQFSVITFSGNGDNDDGSIVDDADSPFKFPGFGSFTMRQPSPANIDEVEQYLNALEIGGETSIGDGLLAATQAFAAAAGPDPDVRTVLLLSDGAENEEAYYNEERRLISAQRPEEELENLGVTVNTIAYGESANQNLMQEIADAHNGFYSFVPVAREAGAGASAARSMALAATAEEGRTPIAADSSQAAQPLEQTQTRLHLSALRTREQSLGLERLAFVTDVLVAGAKQSYTLELPGDELLDGLVTSGWSELNPGVSVTITTPDDDDLDGLIAPDSGDSFKIWKAADALPAGEYLVEVRNNTPDELEFFLAFNARVANPVVCDFSVAQVGKGGRARTVASQERFEHGVPVDLKLALFDQTAAITGAQVEMTITKPDGTTVCGPTKLTDGGEWPDDQPDDGGYAARFYETDQASRVDPAARDGEPDPPTGDSGTYRVALTINGTSNSGRDFTKAISRYFQVTKRENNDFDDDGMPDTHEVYFGLNPEDSADAAQDADNDGLPNDRELPNGTHPLWADTDGGGESDGSEIAAGRCPADAGDDQGVELVGFHIDPPVGCKPERPNAIMLVLPDPPDLETLEIYCSISPHDVTAPGNLLATLDSGSSIVTRYLHDNLTEGRRYHYRIRGISRAGGITPFSGMVSALAKTNPTWPKLDVHLNHRAEFTDQATVLVSLDTSPDVTETMVSTVWPPDPEADWEPVQRNFEQQLELPAAGGEAYLYLKCRNADGEETRWERAFITYDPDGDADGDSIPNAADPDDDGDGLDDADEVFDHHTHPLQTDSDSDGFSDLAELDAGSNPRDSYDDPRADSDGDAFSDGFEQLAGSDHQDASSVPDPNPALIQRSGAGTYEVSVPTTPGALYQLQRRDNLDAAGYWIDQGAAVPGSGSRESRSVTTDGERRNFYRWLLVE